MNKAIVILAFSSASLLAQAPQLHQGNIVYQQLGAMGSPGMGPVAIRMLGPDGPNGQSVTGKPLSAVQERHSIQILGDGTRIENTESSLFYRDDQGRTRTELGKSGAGMVSIQDPVAGFMITLDSVNKIAHKMPLPPLPQPGTMWFGTTGASGAMATGTGSVSAGVVSMGVVSQAQTAGPVRVEARRRVLPAGEVTGALMPAPLGDVFFQRVETSKATPVSEDLGSQTVNGVTAQGTRSTVTIAAGQIGNDRPIQTINERWFSSDIQMLVKSSNTDPRFGDTTYQLTNISRVAPDAALFQIPSDYTIEEGQAGTFNLPVGKPVIPAQ
jgi:hypothetical protein